MPKPYFATADRLALLVGACTAWRGTPWRPKSAVRGVGASCQHAVAGVLRDAGFPLPPVPDGPEDWSRHHSESLQAAWLDAHPTLFAPVPIEDAKPGDVIGFRLGNCIHHAGVLLPCQRFFQCIKSTGAAVLSTTERTYHAHAARAWRPVEEETYGWRQ